MNIRSNEDQLFALWRQKSEYKNKTFVIDGAPCPESFENSPIRCLIILKDPNFGDHENTEEPFNQRNQLATDPDRWWRTVGSWCAGISRINQGKVLDWTSLQHEDIKQSLAPFAFMQLKKTPGGASIENGALASHATLDKFEIKAQINIYRPEVIICCGVGAILVNMLGNTGWQYTTQRGVRYATVDLDGQQAFLIDYMHPSARASKNIVCYGLLDAYAEIIAPMKEQVQL